MTSIVSITSAAQTQIEQILSQHPGQVLLLGVNNKGCSGHSYTFELKQQSELEKFDSVIEVGQHKVAVAALSVLKLIGSTLDYQTDQFGSKFVWHNPMVKNTCGCGESIGF